jgi:hypothetical protein
MDQPLRFCKKEIHLAVTVRSWLPEVSRQHTRLQRQLEEEKKIDYLPSYADNSKKNILTTSSSTSSTAESTATCHARGLSSSCTGANYRQRSGTRHQLAPECDFVDISNATIPTTLGGSTTTSPLIVVVILRQQLDYVIVDYAAPTTPHLIKAKFSSSKRRLLLTIAAPDARGLRHEQSSCISLTSKKL